MGYALRGIALVFESRKLRPFVWGPMLWAGAAYLALFALGLWLGVPWLASKVESVGLNRPLGVSLGLAAFTVAWIFLSGAVFTSLAGWFSSLLWDRLSLEVEKLSSQNPPMHAVGCATVGMDTVARLAFSGAVLLIGLFLGLFTCGIATVLLCGWVGYLDFTASACLRRGMPLTRQFGSCSGLPGAFGFTVAVGVLSLAPLINVILLPGLVAGGTLLIVDAERRGSLRP